MESILTAVFVTQLLAAGIRLAVPVVLASLGETFLERSGMLNIGLDGFMLLGALAGFSVAYTTGSLWAGVLAAILVGALIGLLFAVWCVSLQANQVVAGLSILILTSGCAIYGYKILFGAMPTLPRLTPFARVPIPGLSDIPIVGPILFQHDILTYMCLLLVPICALLAFRTPFGLHATVVGEYPEAADAAGVSVVRTRYVSALLCGALAGVAGGYMALANLGLFTDNMIGGRGFVALALVVFGQWNPIRVLWGGLFFGVVDALQIRLQLAGALVPTQFFIMLPYLLTILVLVAQAGRRKGPAALTRPWVRE